MNELDEAVQHCWARAAVVRFDIEGELAALIDIHTAGRATVAITRDTTRTPALVACVTAVLEHYAWAPPLHGQAIQLPFKFRAPADGQNVIDRALVPWQGQGKVAVSVLLDEHNTANPAVSLLELALDAGASTGRRTAERAEVWFFLGAGTIDGRPVAAEDVAYVPAGAARDVAAPSGTALHAVIAIVPGGPEGAARAGALPTPPSTQRPGSRILASKRYCIGSGPATQAACPASSARIYEAPGVAATVLALPAGAAISEHVHAAETEVVYVLEGSGAMTVNGVELAVTPTSVAQVPRGTRHAVRATSAMRVFQLYAPPGPEQRFKR